MSIDQFFQPYLHLRVEPRGPGALVAERGGGHLPTRIQRSEQRIGRHPHLVKEDLGEVGVAVESDERADLDAGQLHVDNQTGDPLVFRGLRISTHI